VVDFTALSARLDSSGGQAWRTFYISRFDRIIAQHGLEKITRVGVTAQGRTVMGALRARRGTFPGGCDYRDNATIRY